MHVRNGADGLITEGADAGSRLRFKPDGRAVSFRLWLSALPAGGVVPRSGS